MAEVKPAEVSAILRQQFASEEHVGITLAWSSFIGDEGLYLPKW